MFMFCPDDLSIGGNIVLKLPSICRGFVLIFNTISRISIKCDSLEVGAAVFYIVKFS